MGVLGILRSAMGTRWLRSKPPKPPVDPDELAALDRRADRGVRFAKLLVNPDFIEYRAMLEAMEREVLSEFTNRQCSPARLKKVTAELQALRRVIEMPVAVVDDGKVAERDREVLLGDGEDDNENE